MIDEDRILYRAEQFPVFQNKMYATRDAAIHCPKGEIALAQDTDTGVVTNVLFDPGRVVYDSSYQNEQGHSQKFLAHLESVLGIVKRHFDSKKRIVEIGCGKGFFFEMLQKSTTGRAVGFDPAYEGENPSIRKEYYEPCFDSFGDSLILRHVLEHLHHPFDFLASLSSPGVEMKIYIEVPCFDWICEHRAWFDIFYEHVNYFRLSDFSNAFDRIYEMGTFFEGQYLYVVADLGSLKQQPFVWEPVCMPKNFTKNINFFGELIKRGRCNPSVVWGGGQQGCHILSFNGTYGSKNRPPY